MRRPRGGRRVADEAAVRECRGLGRHRARRGACPRRRGRPPSADAPAGVQLEAIARTTRTSTLDLPGPAAPSPTMARSEATRTVRVVRRRRAQEPEPHAEVRASTLVLAELVERSPNRVRRTRRGPARRPAPRARPRETPFFPSQTCALALARGWGSGYTLLPFEPWREHGAAKPRGVGGVWGAHLALGSRSLSNRSRRTTFHTGARCPARAGSPPRVGVGEGVVARSTAPVPGRPDHGNPRIGRPGRRIVSSTRDAGRDAQRVRGPGGRRPAARPLPGAGEARAHGGRPDPPSDPRRRWRDVRVASSSAAGHRREPAPSWLRDRVLLRACCWNGRSPARRHRTPAEPGRSTW